MYKLCAVQESRCSTNQAHHQYKQGCAVQKMDHQALLKERSTEKHFSPIKHYFY